MLGEEAAAGSPGTGGEPAPGAGGHGAGQAASTVADREQLGRLVTEQPNPATADLDRLSTEEICRLINDEDHKVAPAVRTQLPAIAAAAETIAASLRQGGRLFYVGAGTSGRLGVLDAAECPPTFGVDPDRIQGIIAGGPEALVRAVEGAEDDREAGARDLAGRGVGPGDVVVALSASGRTPYCLGALERARAAGARTVAVTCNPGSAMGRLADIAIEVVTGPEVLAGSTRMKAGTAQKLVLNMLSTAAMVRLGKCYGNLMVDLRPTNAKLVERARRILVEVVGCSYEQAAELLEQAGRNVKTAIVMGLTGLPAARAAELLEKHGGFVRQVQAACGEAGRKSDDGERFVGESFARSTDSRSGDTPYGRAPGGAS